MADEMVDHEASAEDHQEPYEDAGTGAASSEETAANAAGPVADDSSPAMNWYIIHAYSGFENKVAESLRGRLGLGKQIGWCELRGRGGHRHLGQHIST